ncbi:MAG: protein kinase [Anaerolineae bacterium]|nr:protein kinase [Anaerolineae bacterium]
MTTTADIPQSTQTSTQSRIKSELEHKYQYQKEHAIADRYRINEPLGAGGFAEVYQCQDLQIDRTVAVKVFTQPRGELTEARVAGRLKHGNIVSVHDAGILNDQTPYIVFEYVAGETLETHLNSATYRRVTLNEQTLTMIRQIASALDYAHGRNVIHRDVKPSNIILGQDGQAYLTDFGLGEIKQAAEHQGRSARSSTLLESRMGGTVPYMAPEQIKGDIAGNKATDLYSFGVVVYEMLTGQLPYHKGRETQIILQIASEDVSPLPPHIANPELPEGVEGVLLRMISKKPEGRYPSAQAFVNELEAASKEYAAANTLYDKALAFVADGAWREAVRAFEEIERRAPGHKDVRLQLEQARQKVKLLDLRDEAEKHVVAENFQAALDTLVLIEKIDPNTDTAGLRDRAIAGLEREEQRSLAEQYKQARQQLADGEYAAVLNTLAVIFQKNPNYLDPENIREQAQKEVDYQNHLRQLYNQGVEYSRQEKWGEALQTFQELEQEKPGYEDVQQRLFMARHVFELSTLLEQARKALDERNFKLCLDTVAEITRKNPDFKPADVAHTRQEALDKLYRQGQRMIEQENFAEALTAVTLLRERQPDYPGVDDLVAAAQIGLEQQQLKTELDQLYAHAGQQLTENKFVDVLQTWALIQEQKGNIEYADSQFIAQRARDGIYGNSLAALADGHPQKALKLWRELRSYDDNYNDHQQVEERAEQKLHSRARNRRLAFQATGGIILLILLLWGGRACYQNAVAPVIAPTETPTPTATATPTFTNTPTFTATPTASPTATNTPTNTPTSTTTPTFTPTHTPTNTPTITPKPTVAATANQAASILDDTEATATELAQVRAGETVTVLGITANGNWLRVRNVAGVEGWVAENRFNWAGSGVPVLNPGEISPTPESQTTALDAATIFCGPDVTYQAVKDIPAGTVVQVVGRWNNRSWLYVRDTSNAEGFVAARFFDFPSDKILSLPIMPPKADCASTITGTPPTPVIASATPAAALRLDIWPIGDGRCDGATWIRDVYMQGQGGNGTYTYFWNNVLMGGPTSGSVTFEVRGTGSTFNGTGRVTSGGQSVETILFVPGITCP